MPLMPLTVRFTILALLLFAAACAKGGSDNRPPSEVEITASHHMFGFKSLSGFGAFPPDPQLVFTDRGTFHLFDNSTYTNARPAGTSSPESYALANDGELTLFVPGSGHEPSVVFVGGYSLTTTNADLFFTDRVSTLNSASIGLFVATKVIPGQVELEGNWHLGSLHVIFDQAILSPDNVARAAWGGVAIAAGAPGTVRTISGSGFQGSGQMNFGGTIQNLLVNSVGDGSLNLTVDYTLLGQPADSRVFEAAAGPDLVLGLDADESDGEAGMLFMLRAHDAPATPADPQEAAGTFHAGGYTAFVNPVDPGSDAFTGVVTLTHPDGFRLDAVGHEGIAFSYTGTYTLAGDGGLTIAINGTNETWHGAIDREYKTLFFVDDFQEARSSGQIELNLGFGVRVDTN